MSSSEDQIAIFSSTTPTMKWWIAISLGVLFFIFASGGFGKLTNSVSEAIHGPVLFRNGGYTGLGLFISALLFTFLIRLLLW